MTSLLLKNAALIVAMDDEDRRWSNGGIYVVDNAIAQIGPMEELPQEADQVIDARNMVILPGLVNTHHHFYQTLTRNLPAAQDANLFQWLRVHYPIWAGMTPEAIAVSTKIALAELMLSGCTTSSDHTYMWPNGARLAFWVIPNIEFFSLEEQVPKGAGGSGNPAPDVPQWAARDYGNRMGIPTVNGALVFDERYLANPLVFCGTVGLIPVGRTEKAARPGDWILLGPGDYKTRSSAHPATRPAAPAAEPQNGNNLRHPVIRVTDTTRPSTACLAPHQPKGPGLDQHLHARRLPARRPPPHLPSPLAKEAAPAQGALMMARRLPLRRRSCVASRSAPAAPRRAAV